MAVFTLLNEQEISDFLEAYALGTLVSVAPIAEGVENTNYKLEIRTPCRQFFAVLTVFEARVPEAELPYYLGLVAHVAAAGFAAPQPYPQKNGTLFGHIKGKPAAISQWLEGRNNAPATAVHLQALGMAAAQFHAATQGFEGTRTHMLSPFRLAPLATTMAQRLDEIEQGLWEKVQAELEWLSTQRADGLPQGHIHADLFPDNVFFDDTGEVSGFIDFYFSAPDALVYELAVMANCWCFDEKNMWQPALWNALLAGYESVRKLSIAERQALPMLSRGAALRFMLTRAQQWLAPKTERVLNMKNPNEYLEKWCAHQQGKTL